MTTELRRGSKGKKAEGRRKNAGNAAGYL